MNAYIKLASLRYILKYKLYKCTFSTKLGEPWHISQFNYQKYLLQSILLGAYHD